MSANSPSFGAVRRAEAASRLAAFERRPVVDDRLRPAAVAVVLVRRIGAAVDEADSVLLTKRPWHLKRHAGQFALPGGRLDPDETVRAAARRELAEELGLRLSPDASIGMLDDVATRSGFRITPVVYWAPGIPGDENLTPDPDEVAAIYRVPLRELDDDGSRHLDPIPESSRPVLSLDLPSTGTRIFAPTAAILFQLREVVLHGRGTRIDGFEQPPFAWK